MTNTQDDRQSVYEIGYLIVSSIPEEKVPEESSDIRRIIEKAGASVIADEAAHRERLAYTIRRKTVSGSYDKYDEAYFGWVKFELSSGEIEAVKKAIETKPSVLRMLLITTVKENTYLGKRAAAFVPKTISAGLAEDKKDAAPASIEAMDKSIDDMVKEV